MIGTRRQGWIGVDFGAHTVKVAQVERRKAGYRLLRGAIARRRAPWNANIGPDSNALESANELNVALDMAGGATLKEAACVLSMRLYDHRGMRVSKPDATAETETQQQLNSVFGENAVSRFFDYWSVQSADTHRNAENINTLSIASEWSNRVCDDLHTAGLYAETLDGPPLALARALALSHPDSAEKPTLIIDWGFNRITVCLVLGSQPLFVRCLRESGYRMVLEAVERSLGVNANEAQKVLCDFGLPDVVGRAGDELQQVISESLSDALGVVSDELERTLAYLQMNRRSNEPEEAWLFGGGATLRNADRFIERAIGIRTQNWTLDGEPVYRNASGACPLPMLGSAIALSALAWEAA